MSEEMELGEPLWSHRGKAGTGKTTVRNDALAGIASAVKSVTEPTGSNASGLIPENRRQRTETGAASRLTFRKALSTHPDKGGE